MLRNCLSATKIIHTEYFAKQYSQKQNSLEKIVPTGKKSLEKVISTNKKSLEKVVGFSKKSVEKVLWFPLILEVL